SFEKPARQLLKALQTATKRYGLSDSALNGAASASIALRQKGGGGYPADHVRKRVAIVLYDLTDIENRREEREKADPPSLTHRIKAIFNGDSAAGVAGLRKGMEAALTAYCVARGSSPEWRRASSTSIPKAS